VSDARLVDEAPSDAVWVPDVDLETRLAELELLGELGVALSTTVDLATCSTERWLLSSAICASTAP
jgi:hypothetical protein